ncbi:MAG TPA: hypothetical protein VF188_00215 [Longimicrobiales bacterium]
MATGNPYLPYVMLALQMTRAFSEIGEQVAKGELTPAQADRRFEQLGNRVAKARARWKAADAAAREREAREAAARKATTARKG